MNASTANIQTAHKHKTFKQLLSQNRLTPATYRQRLKTQLTANLEAKGYSQQQITIALQHKTVGQLHRKLHKSQP